MIPLSEIGDGLHVGIPDHPSPFGSIRFSAQTVDDGPRGRYIVLVGEGSQAIGSTVQTAVVALAVAGPIVIAVSAGATYLLVRRSLRSVDEIRSRVADISTSDLTERVPVPDSRDEIAALAVTMNEMLSRIEAGHTAQRRFVGDASHELRSPLTTIISALEVATSHPELLDKDLATTTLIPEAQRMKALIDDLLLLARADERDFTTARDDVDLDDLAAAEAEDCAAKRLSMCVPRSIRCGWRAMPRAMLRVLRNLLDNAQRHASSRVEVGVGLADGHAVLTVGDDGPGHPLSVPHSVSSTDSSGWTRTGHAPVAAPGSGLVIVREIVAAHQGSVVIDAAGPAVELLLPFSCRWRARPSRADSRPRGLFHWCWCRTEYQSCGAHSRHTPPRHCRHLRSWRPIRCAVSRPS